MYLRAFYSLSEHTAIVHRTSDELLRPIDRGQWSRASELYTSRVMETIEEIAKVDGQIIRWKLRALDRAEERNATSPAVRNDGVPLIQSDVNNVGVLMELRHDKAAFLRVPLLSPAVCHILPIIISLNARRAIWIPVGAPRVHMVPAIIFP